MKIFGKLALVFLIIPVALTFMLCVVFLYNNFVKGNPFEWFPFIQIIIVMPWSAYFIIGGGLALKFSFSYSDGHVGRLLNSLVIAVITSLLVGITFSVTEALNVLRGKVLDVEEICIIIMGCVSVGVIITLLSNLWVWVSIERHWAQQGDEGNRGNSR